MNETITPKAPRIEQPLRRGSGGAAETKRHVPTGTSHKSQSGNNGQRHKRPAMSAADEDVPAHNNNCHTSRERESVKDREWRRKRVR